MKTSTDADGNTTTKPVMNVDEVVGRIVKTMRVREEKEGKEYGVIVLAEGLAEFLPSKQLEGVPRDDHGHISITQIQLGKMFAKLVGDEYAKQTGQERKVVGLQIGYEARCSKPHAFDVMLGSQLGVGGYRALAERGLNGVMVSVSGQLDLNYVPFEELVDPKDACHSRSLRETWVRFSQPRSIPRDIRERVELLPKNSGSKAHRSPTPSAQIQMKKGVVKLISTTLFFYSSVRTPFVLGTPD